MPASETVLNEFQTAFSLEIDLLLSRCGLLIDCLKQYQREQQSFLDGQIDIQSQVSALLKFFKTLNDRSHNLIFNLTTLEENIRTMVADFKNLLAALLGMLENKSQLPECKQLYSIVYLLTVLTKNTINTALISTNQLESLEIGRASCRERV